MEQTQPQGAPMKLLLTMGEAAEALSLSRRFLYELVMTKQIVTIKIGTARRVPVEALEVFIKQLMQVA